MTTDWNKYAYSNQKNLHVFKLLISDPTFQDEVKLIREKINLNKYKNLDDWYTYIEQESDKFLESDFFKTSVAEIKENTNISYKDKRQKIYDLYSHDPLNYINRFCEKVIKERNLPPHFDHSINSYILTGSEKPFGITPPFHFVYEKGNDGKIRKDQVTFTVRQQLSKDDFERLKYHIQLKTRHLPNYSEISDIDNKIEIEKAYRTKNDDLYDGESVNNTHLAEEYLEDKNENKRIWDIANRLQKLRHKLFRSSADGGSV